MKTQLFPTVAIKGAYCAVLTVLSLCITSKSDAGELYVVENNNGVIGTFDSTSGAALNANFITGLNMPESLLVANGLLYEINYGTGDVRTYDPTSGVVINASFITSLSLAQGLAIAGNTLYVIDNPSGSGAYRVGTYNATTGAPSIRAS